MRESTPAAYREAIPERSRGLRRFAATPGRDEQTRMNPEWVPEHDRHSAREARSNDRIITHPRRANQRHLPIAKRFPNIAAGRGASPLPPDATNKRA